MRNAILAPILALVAPLAGLHGAQPDFQSKYLSIGLSRTQPAFAIFSVDSLGQGKLAHNPILANSEALPALQLANDFTYTLKGKPIWKVRFDEKTITLRAEHVAGVDAPTFVLMFNQKQNHATLLGLMKPGERQMGMPCILHLPDMGTLRVTGQGAIDYDARRWKVKTPFVRVAFQPPTAQRQRVEYKLEVVSIYPKLPGIEQNPLYDGFRRDWLNIFQINPRVQMLANNSASDPVGFTLFEYSNLARHTPPLADGLTALDLVRMTLDRYLAGAKGYGQVGYGREGVDADLVAWGAPYMSLDTLPSFLISACDYVEGANDLAWARANYAKLLAWGKEMFAADKDGNGLIEYPASGNLGDRPTTNRRGSNWWDTINFGHEDAFANALAYHAATRFAALARSLDRAGDAAWLSEKSARLRDAYAKTLLNPQTGLIAGWRSKDGQLHDYAFTFIQGAAITYGLLDDKTANSVMDKLLEKIKAVGFTRFDLGLPGNLVPIKKGDYVLENHPPERFGEPRLDDGSDGFQFYENGGATGCWCYYTIHSLYKLGRAADARRIFHPMLEGFARGEFQGFDSSGRSRDWRDWKGGGHGYEGLLVDNYHALLAVLDDVQAQKP